MTNKTQVALVEGTFTTTEANEILMNLFSSKIHFHEMKDQSSRERFGMEDKHSMKRIPELIESKTALAAFLQEVKAPDARIRIISHVEVELLNTIPEACLPEEK